MTRILIIAAGALLLGACAKSQQPLPNKNTNWLDQCESDADCGEALECRCGVCTVTCESDSECAGDDRRAMCWDERSEALAERCGAPASMEAVCVPAEIVSMEGRDGGPPEPECPTPASCLETIIDDIGAPTALAIQGERVYWLEQASTDPATLNERYDGALRSARYDGSDVITIADELRPWPELELDATHAYFVHVMGKNDSTTVLSRVPLAGGELTHIYEGDISEEIALAGERVLFMTTGWYEPEYRRPGSIVAAPVDGSLYTNELYIPEPADVVAEDPDSQPLALAVSGGDLHWANEHSVMHLDMEAGGEPFELVSEASPLYNSLVRHGDHLLFLSLQEDGQSGDLLSIDLLHRELAWRADPTPALAMPGLAVDATHAYWRRADPTTLRTTIVRTDRVTRQTEELMTLEDSNFLIALSEDYVFLAITTYDDDDSGSGSIARFPK